MKTKLILLAILLPFLGKAQSGPYTVHGKADLPVNSKVYLLWYNINSGKHVDSTLIDAQGGFGFKGTMQQPELGQLIFGSQQRSAVFYLEPGTINISSAANAMYPVLSGTPLNNDYNQFYAMMAPMLDSMNNAAKLKGLKGSYTQFSNEVNPQKLNILRKFIKEHPNSLLSIYQLNIYASKTSDPFPLDSLYKQLSPAMKKTTAGTELASRIRGMYSGKVGDTALQFTLPDTNGKMVSLSDFKGKYVLLDFWATWCGPCIAEMPNVSSAYQKYKDKNFTIIGVSLDRPDSKKKWLDMIQKENFNWIQLSDLNFWNSKAALLYNVNSVPANFLIDPQGKIIAKNLRGDALKVRLESIFN